MAKKKKFGDNVANTITGTINRVLGIKESKAPENQGQPPQPKPQETSSNDNTNGKTFVAERDTGAIEKAKTPLIEAGLSEKQAQRQVLQNRGTAIKTQPLTVEQANANKLNAPNVQSNVQLGNTAGDTAANLGLSTTSLIAGASTGATLGATVGSVVPVLGTAGGAIIGGVLGGLTAVSAKIASDKRQATKEAFKVYTNGKARDTEILNLANSGIYNPEDIVFQYQLNVANLRAAESELKKQTEGKVNKQLSGAMDELIQVQLYLSHEEERRIRLEQALANPNPSLIYQTDVIDFENQ